MTLNELVQALGQMKELHIAMPDGRLLPSYFHITELGKTEKTYLDCGGTLRKETATSFQIWTAQDYDHRLSPAKLLSIIQAAEGLNLDREAPVQVEYRTDVSLSVFGLQIKDSVLQLVALEAACQAPDSCGIPAEKKKVSLKDLQTGCCSPASGCC